MGQRNSSSDLNGKSNNREYRDINYEDIHGLNEDERDALAKKMMRNRELFLTLMMNKTKNILDGIHSIDNLMRDTLESTLRRKSDLHEEDSNRDILVHISTQGFSGYINFKKILMHLISESESQELLREERRVADCIKEKRKDHANDNDAERDQSLDKDDQKGAEGRALISQPDESDQPLDTDHKKGEATASISHPDESGQPLDTDHKKAESGQPLDTDHKKAERDQSLDKDDQKGAEGRALISQPAESGQPLDTDHKKDVVSRSFDKDHSGGAEEFVSLIDSKKANRKM